jgi:hypothetical protein
MRKEIRRARRAYAYAPDGTVWIYDDFESIIETDETDDRYTGVVLRPDGVAPPTIHDLLTGADGLLFEVAKGTTGIERRR